MIIYKLINLENTEVGNIDVKNDKIIVSNKEFINEFYTMREAIEYVKSNKLSLEVV